MYILYKQFSKKVSSVFYNVAFIHVCVPIRLKFNFIMCLLRERDVLCVYLCMSISACVYLWFCVCVFLFFASRFCFIAGT